MLKMPVVGVSIKKFTVMGNVSYALFSALQNGQISQEVMKELLSLLFRDKLEARNVTFNGYSYGLPCFILS